MKKLTLVVLCAVGLSASMGWAKVKCLAETPSEPNYECELEEGHEGEHLDKLSDGMSVNWTKDMSVKAFEKLEAENEELKKKLELYESTSTIHISTWPAFCEERGHCWEFKQCFHATVGHNCSHSACKHCGAKIGREIGG